MKKCKFKTSFKFIQAFTLAEVLITLGIIGIVAALTIPSLVNNTNSKEFYSRCKKVYAELDNVTRQIANDNGGVLPDCGYWTHSCLYQLYKPYLKVAQTCASGEHGCWSEANQWYGGYGYLTNNTPCPDGATCGLSGLDYAHSIGGGYHRSVVLNSGEFVWFVQYWAGNTSRLLAVDLNGAKKPNKISRDIVLFCFTQNSLAICPANAGYNPDYIYVPSQTFIHSATEKYLRDLDDINNP